MSSEFILISVEGSSVNGSNILRSQALKVQFLSVIFHWFENLLPVISVSDRYSRL